MSTGEGGAPTVVLITAQRDLDAAAPVRPGWRGWIDRLAGLAERGVGGVQVASRQSARALRSRGAEVLVVTPFDGRFGGPLLASACYKVLAKVHPSWGARWHRWWRMTLAERNVRRRTRSLQPPVVWYPQDPLSASIALRCRGNADRVVAACHYSHGSEGQELVLRGVVPEGHPLPRRILGVEREVLGRADALVFVSDAARDATLARLGPGIDTPAYVVPNTVDDRIDRTPEEVASSPPVRDLVTVGTMNPIKRHDLLVRVVAALAADGRETTLTIVGDGPCRSAVVALAEELGVGRLLRLTGSMSDVRHVLTEHRLYVHTAEAESFGLAVAEAMALSMPVAVVPVGGLRGLVRDGLDGVHLSADPAEAAGDIASLLDDPARLREMGAAAHQRIEESFRDSVVGPQLLAVLSPGTSHGWSTAA